MDPILNEKSVGISAIMGDSNLTRIINDAMDSPAGSAKRVQAASILKSLGGSSGMSSIPTSNVGGSIGPTGEYVPPITNAQLTAPVRSTPTTSTKPGEVAAKTSPDSLRSLSPTDLPTPGGLSIGPDGKVTGVAEPVESMLAPKKKVLFSKLPEKPVEQPPLKWTQTQVDADYAARLKSGSTPEEASAGTFRRSGIQPTTVESFEEGLGGEEKGDWQSLIEEAAILGVGKNALFISIMEDKNKLRMIPGLENMPDEALESMEGAFLSDKLDDLSDSLKKQFKLEAFGNRVELLNSRGLTITDDLNNYISSKDEYVEKLDGMIMDTKEAISETTTPWVEKRLNKYMDYLTIMKGKQQTRYIDYLNMGINYHNAEITRAESAYTSAYNRFNDELKTEGAKTAEKYNVLKSLIFEMYDNVTGREKNEMEAEKLQNDLIKSRAEALKALAGLDDTSGWSSLSNDKQTLARANYLRVNPDKTPEEAMLEFNALTPVEKFSWINRTQRSFTSATDLSNLKIIRGMIEEGKPMEAIEEKIKGYGYSINEMEEYINEYIADYTPAEAGVWTKFLNWISGK